MQACMKCNESHYFRAFPKQHLGLCCKRTPPRYADPHRSHACDVWRMLPGSGGAAAAEGASQVRTGQQAAVCEA